MHFVKEERTESQKNDVLAAICTEKTNFTCSPCFGVKDNSNVREIFLKSL